MLALVGIRIGRRVDLSELPQNDSCPALSAAHLAAELQGLAIRHPAIERVTMRRRLERQKCEVDTAVRSASLRIHWQRIGDGRPRAHPWGDAPFKRSDDASGDLRIEVVMHDELLSDHRHAGCPGATRSS